MVIAIIALLMSILMPALSKAKKQAKGVMCLSNLHQWALALSMYTADNKGFFLAGVDGETGGWAWMEWLRPYYKNDDIHLCPIASKARGQEDYESGDVFHAWNPGTLEDPLYGSYGLNGWLANPRRGESRIFGRPVDKNWRTTNVKGAGYIPVIVGCGIWDSWPLQTDDPPDSEFEEVQHGVLNSEMKRFCLNRHFGYVHGAFADWSVRRIGLKELWRLKWHRGYDVNGDMPAQFYDQNHWLYRFKNY